MQFWSSLSPTGFFVADTAGNLLRYLIMAGGAYLVAWRWLRGRLAQRRIQPVAHTPKRLASELSYSMSTVAIFGAVGLIIALCGKASLTRIYFNLSERGYPYLLLSLAAMLVIHDAYFYWMHRLLHHPKLFKHVHRVHHLSTNPSPLAAYSFHPLEAIAEALFFPLVVLVMPLHFGVVVAFILIDMAFNVLGHLGYELFPSGFTKHRLGRWLNTSTHHNMHHKYFNSNFSLYFNFWDRVCGTNHSRYHEVFESAARRRLAEDGPESARPIAKVHHQLPPHSAREFAEQQRPAVR
jgi:sterol desaturase/sphingolipid hydroxylase (fatty acid hydroxylase superfamily)